MPVPPQLLGRTVGAARGLYTDAVLAGVMRNGVLQLQNDIASLERTELGPQDQLVMFAHAGISGEPQPNNAAEALYKWVAGVGVLVVAKWAKWLGAGRTAARGSQCGRCRTCSRSLDAVVSRVARHSL